VLRRTESENRPGVVLVDICATFMLGDEPMRGTAQMDLRDPGVTFPYGNTSVLDVEGKAMFSVSVPVSEAMNIPVMISLESDPDLNIKGVIGPRQAIIPKLWVSFEQGQRRFVPIIQVSNSETNEPLEGIVVEIVDANAETEDRHEGTTDRFGEPPFQTIRLAKTERERDIIISLKGYPGHIHREWLAGGLGDLDPQPMPRPVESFWGDVRAAWLAGSGEPVERPLPEGEDPPLPRSFWRSVVVGLTYWLASTFWRRRYVRWSTVATACALLAVLLAHPVNHLLGVFHSEMPQEKQDAIHDESVWIAARVVGGGAYDPAEDIARLTREREETENPFRKGGMTTDLRKAWEELGRREGFMKSTGHHVTLRVQRGPGTARMDMEAGRGQAVSADSAPSDLRKAWEKLGQQEGWLHAQEDSSSTRSR
jgi:hypothetical protein